MTVRNTKPKKTTKYNNELTAILNEADKITMDNLDFNKTFTEQGAILCDIKKMLASNQNKQGDNKPFVCNPIIKSKLNDKNFSKLYENFKKGKDIAKIRKYKQKSVPTRMTTIKRKSIKRKSIKRKTRITKKVKSKPIKKSVDNQQKQEQKMQRQLKTEKAIKDINARYPVVIIKRRAPRKNVLYMNNLDISTKK
jgi:hypothetical protein